MSEQRALSGRVAMITGASSGIGEAAAHVFADAGAALVLVARRGERLRALAGRIEDSGGRALAVEGDVTDSGRMREAVEAAVETYGGLDCALNNAGYATAGVPMHEIDDQVFRQTMDVNVGGVWNCMRHQIAVMLRGTSGGSIVNTASVAATRATGAGAAYVAAKHAVLGLTRAAAADYGTAGIRVNALIVGATRTEMMEGVLSRHAELEERFLADTVQKRMAAPSEVAEAALWLCSDRASFVTGSAVPVDGGATAI
ncbi:SDR family NAD(P)-dependent oxidoreductase [Streptomyces nitrosporeus]|uniref:Glucose 1-dehydrogenase n=1 Tax=Streptomyces nitrosporeus TaxID=28894 RepID=A0A5J6FB39_9ACTN|nr:glucose 1-dehydrogenase [Streptomyces nitrosporeus]QEU72190.1 glucose 1-dehydrogenase [Streptomyces nitrosporeus]GGY79809.1 short chain dehydrogenase [Streptomyces nitrosporeus]